MSTIHSGLVLLGVTILLICLPCAGCRKATPPITYYTLSPIAASEASPSPMFKHQSVTLGVGPVRIPEYLSTSKLIVRSSPHRLDMKEFHRWAGSLHSNIMRVLSENFSALMGIDHVLVYPWERSRVPDYQVEIDIQALDGGPDDAFHLKAVWRLLSNLDSAHTTVRTSRITKKINSSDLEGMVSAVSQALAEMSREITAAVETSHTQNRL